MLIHVWFYLYDYLVGGFNPSEKNESNLDHFPNFRAENKTYLSCHHLVYHDSSEDILMINLRLPCSGRSISVDHFQKKWNHLVIWFPTPIRIPHIFRVKTLPQPSNSNLNRDTAPRRALSIASPFQLSWLRCELPRELWRFWTSANGISFYIHMYIHICTWTLWKHAHMYIYIYNLWIMYIHNFIYIYL